MRSVMFLAVVMISGAAIAQSLPRKVSEINSLTVEQAKTLAEKNGPNSPKSRQ